MLTKYRYRKFYYGDDDGILKISRQLIFFPPLYKGFRNGASRSEEETGWRLAIEVLHQKQVCGVDNQPYRTCVRSGLDVDCELSSLKFGRPLPSAKDEIYHGVKCSINANLKQTDLLHGRFEDDILDSASYIEITYCILLVIRQEFEGEQFPLDFLLRRRKCMNYSSN
ncbi:hypothetical protein ANN_02553 [Periplaneta americana]|uniref:Uncharacterized protein n=1 Tax=Periplaneta americana TaxID=6978 RepID=A0ABQ8TZ51_PERAM|nr:hypothetical protein ANN_02553 [Periplaneta americana]